MFRHHLWSRLQTHVDALGREVGAQINKRYAPFLSVFRYDILLTTNNRADSVPRWRGLNHFMSYLAVEFTDGSKWEDMSKVRHNQYFNVRY